MWFSSISASPDNPSRPTRTEWVPRAAVSVGFYWCFVFVDVYQRWVSWTLESDTNVCMIDVLVCKTGIWASERLSLLLRFRMVSLLRLGFERYMSSGGWLHSNAYAQKRKCLPYPLLTIGFWCIKWTVLTKNKRKILVVAYIVINKQILGLLDYSINQSSRYVMTELTMIYVNKWLKTICWIIKKIWIYTISTTLNSNLLHLLKHIRKFLKNFFYQEIVGFHLFLIKKKCVWTFFQRNIFSEINCFTSNISSKILQTYRPRANLM